MSIKITFSVMYFHCIHFIHESCIQIGNSLHLLTARKLSVSSLAHVDMWSNVSVIWFGKSSALACFTSSTLKEIKKLSTRVQSVDVC